MGQEEVLKILKEKRDWMSVNEIMKILNVSNNRICIALRKLYRQDEIIKKLVKTRGWPNLWKWKDTKDAQNG